MRIWREEQKSPAVGDADDQIELPQGAGAALWLEYDRRRPANHGFNGLLPLVLRPIGSGRAQRGELLARLPNRNDRSDSMEQVDQHSLMSSFAFGFLGSHSTEARANGSSIGESMIFFERPEKYDGGTRIAAHDFLRIGSTESHAGADSSSNSHQNEQPNQPGELPIWGEGKKCEKQYPTDDWGCDDKQEAADLRTLRFPRRWWRGRSIVCRHLAHVRHE